MIILINRKDTPVECRLVIDVTRCEIYIHTSRCNCSVQCPLALNILNFP